MSRTGIRIAALMWLGIGFVAALLAFHALIKYPSQLKRLLVALVVGAVVAILIWATGASEGVFFAIIVAYIALRLWRRFIELPPSVGERPSGSPVTHLSSRGR